MPSVLSLLSFGEFNLRHLMSAQPVQNYGWLTFFCLVEGISLTKKRLHLMLESWLTYFSWKHREALSSWQKPVTSAQTSVPTHLYPRLSQ